MALKMRHYATNYIHPHINKNVQIIKITVYNSVIYLYLYLSSVKLTQWPIYLLFNDNDFF